MKLLKVRVEGLDLFQNGLELNFIAQQKVTETNKNGLFHLFDSIYKQNVLGIVGINASGKTTALKWLSLVLDIYLNDGTINNENYDRLIQNQKVKVEAYFFDGRDIIKIFSTFNRKNGKLVFTEEQLWRKKFTSSMSRTQLFQFTEKHCKIIRSQEELPFLSDHMSIMISVLKKQKHIPLIVDLLRDTNINMMRVDGNIPSEIVHFLDESVEYIKYEKSPEKKPNIRLKFKSQNHEIIIFDPLELEAYLSSGTIKGLNVFAGIQNVLITGGFLIIDEIENHFNKEIVRTILDFFKHKEINVYGATLIFTTHYSELLDDFERNDSIYIAFKEDTLILTNLDQILKRSDYKKSEVYQSSYLGKTAPSYDAYMNVKNYFIHIGRKIKEN